MNHVQNHNFPRDTMYLQEIRAGGAVADAAISELYHRYRTRTRLVIQRLIRAHPEFKGEADDLVHDAFIILIHKIREDRTPMESLSNFWIGIGKKLFLNQLKKDQRVILVHEPYESYGAEETDPESILLQKEEYAFLERTFRQLGQRCQTILLLWIDRYTMTDIAQLTGLSSVAMARKTKYNCFKKLKELAREGHTPPA